MSLSRHALPAACLVLVVSQAAPASAAFIAYLSRAGAGNACTLASPCVSMITALANAGDGGEVICLDKGAYSPGFIAITRSVTISCGDGLWEATGRQLDITTPAGADVLIEGLVIDGGATGCCSLSFLGQGSLRLRRVRSGNIVGANSHGLAFTPNGPATLHVSESVFYNNGGSGIFVQPQPGGYANVHVRDTRFERNAHGLLADGRFSVIGVNVNISDSIAAENSGNGFGALTIAGKAPVTISITNSHVSGNLGDGLAALGATIAVGGSMITANATGVAAVFGGQILSWGDNQLRFNGTNGAFTDAAALQ